MKVSAVNVLSQKQQQKDKTMNTPFKGFDVLGLTSSIMQGVESKGYIMSFLIQDGFGMTAPRVGTGFMRDKEITGEYNFQEGLEVLGREGMTGPYIMFVAPVVLFITGLFCKSTNVNTMLIKRIGNNLKEIVKDPAFDKSVMKDSEQFKKLFYERNIEQVYKNTVKNDKNPDDTIRYILKEFEIYDKSNVGEFRAQAAKNITDKINSRLMETSDTVLDINKVYIGDGKARKAFDTKRFLEALKAYGHDAIQNNPNAANIDEKAAENIKNNFAAKRLLTNIANVVITLGGLSVLPKLYAKSDVSPGEKTQQFIQQKKQQAEQSNGENNNPNFKGRGINTDGIFARMGKFITRYFPEKFHELMEYTGYNFSKTTFACLATLGLLFPRGRRAWQRAPKEDDGTRDLTEIYEIFLRDTVSSLSVVFTVPMLTKMIVKSYEEKSGFILTNRASDGKSWLGRVADVLNPYSDLGVISLQDIDSIYGKIDNKDKLVNFAEFVDKKGGDLEKILSKSDNQAVMFNDKTFTLESIRNMPKKAKNEKIISMIKKLPEHSEELISKVMKGDGNIKNNPIAKFARDRNAFPEFVSTFVLSPILLGVLIPMLTYYNTRKYHERRDREREQRKNQIA